MFKLKSILLSVLLLTGLTAYAQQITVTGTVTSSTDGYGVIGADNVEIGRILKMQEAEVANQRANVENINARLDTFLMEYNTQRIIMWLVIAFAVGFGTPSYFSKCYKELFGHVPGEER